MMRSPTDWFTLFHDEAMVVDSPVHKPASADCPKTDLARIATIVEHAKALIATNSLPGV